MSLKNICLYTIHMTMVLSLNISKFILFKFAQLEIQSYYLLSPMSIVQIQDTLLLPRENKNNNYQIIFYSITLSVAVQKCHLCTIISQFHSYAQGRRTIHVYMALSEHITCIYFHLNNQDSIRSHTVTSLARDVSYCPGTNRVSIVGK